MLDFKTATKQELSILLEGLMELNYGAFDKNEVEEIKRLKGEIRKELLEKMQKE